MVRARALFVVWMVLLGQGRAVHAQSAPLPIPEPTPTVDPRAVPLPIPIPTDPASTPGEAPPLPDEQALVRMIEADVAEARPIVRRAARSSDRPEVRSLALRLIGAHDPSSATGRICARALRIDTEPNVRRAASECLGRLGPEHAEAHTHVLVAALDDENLDVVTMSGWALANGGAPVGYERVAAMTRHEDGRVARLFLGYAERMRARLGLDFTVTPDDAPARDAQGRQLVPPAVALTATTNTVDTAVAVAWLGVYGASVGWLHGVLVPSAQGGPDGALIAPLLGLGGSALGATALATYGFVRADSLLAAHTIVQLGTAGTIAGFGAGILTGEPPSNAVAASSLSLLGTLGGTALGIALVEADAAPTAGSLALGAFAGVATGIGVGGLARAYLPSPGAAFGMAGLVGGLSAGATTLATRDRDVGLFPLAGGTLGLLVGAGVGGGAALIVERNNYTQTSGWLVLSGAALGAAAGALGGLALPRGADPFLSPDVRPDVKIEAPSWVLLDDGRGGTTNAFVMAGSF